MTDERINCIHDELAAAERPCEMSIVLSSLSDDDLRSVHDDFLDQYGQELAMGALERSDWLYGTFVINANQPSISFVRTALDAVRTKMKDRKVMMAAEVGTEFLN